MKPTRVVAALAALAFLFPAAGCIRYQEELVVLPDGSGKLVMSMGFNLEILGKFKEMGMDFKEQSEEMEFDFKDLEKFEGLVAFSKPRSEKKGTWRTWTVTGYFDDINKVKMLDTRGAEKVTKLSFAFKKDGEGYALEIDDRLMVSDDTKRLEEMPPESADAGWEMMKQFLKGFELSRGIRMPGSVTASEGFVKKEGRLVANSINEESLKGVPDLAAAVKATKRKVVCGKSEMSDGDLAALKKEITEARDAWPKILEELKAAAEKRKKSE